MITLAGERVFEIHTLFLLKIFKKSVLHFAMRYLSASYLPNLSGWEVSLPRFGRISVFFHSHFPKSFLEPTHSVGFKHTLCFKMLVGGIIL